jgi:hypothetical protein
MTTFKKIVRIGTQKEYNNRGSKVDADIFCKIEYRAKNDPDKFELSISGVIGPKSNGDALGGCGQICISSMDEINKIKPAPLWNKTKIKKFMQIWDDWHLNDMNAATPDMKKAGWVDLASKEIFKYSFHRTDEAQKEYEQLERALIDAGIDQVICPLNDRQIRLLKSKRWLDVFDYIQPENPEFMEMQKDYRTNQPKIERKTLGWVDTKEHPDGLLGRELNGFKYGSTWYYEPVPEDVLQWLKDLPDTDKTPAWV